MFILIMGKCATGKDTVARKLEEQGLSSVISHTTRPRRNADDRHVFVSEEEADALWDESVARTVVDGYRYFATREDILSADIYVVDIAGFWELTQGMPETQFVICYLDADDESRRAHAIARDDDQDVATRIFDRRDSKEAPAYDEFKQMLSDEILGKGDGLPHNVQAYGIFQNDYEPSTLDVIVRDINLMIS